MVQAMLLEALDEVFAAPAPAEELALAWAEAGEALPMVKAVMSRWWNKEADAQVVTGELEAAQKQIENALQLAEKALSKEYGIPRCEIEQFREEALADFRDIMSGTPAPE